MLLPLLPLAAGRSRKNSSRRTLWKEKRGANVFVVNATSDHAPCTWTSGTELRFLPQLIIQMLETGTSLPRGVPSQRLPI